MKVPVYSMTGEEVSTVELPASVFEAKINRGLMHQALVRQLANARYGTHKAKSRSEIRRTGAKAYRQKGTGRARHGSRRAPIFVGGGVAHGPLPRSYRKDMPRKMRRAALRSALTVKAENDDIFIIDEVTLDVPKTKEMVTIVDNVAGDYSALVLIAEKNDAVEKSANNIPDVKTLLASYLNVRDLLGYEKIVISLSALDVIADQLHQEDFEPFEELEEEE